jgi:F0F1-type ATP synthase assembly protein I
LPESLARLRGEGSGKSLGAAGKYAGLGVQFVASILLFLYLGQWLYRRLGTAPLFLYVGVFTGAGAAFYSMYRMLMADQRREEAERARSRTADRERDRAGDRDRDSGTAK